jgi:hypothetical protein
MSTNQNGKLQELMEKWGAKSAMLLLMLCAFIYQQDRANLIADNKANSARIAASERAIGRLQEGKASREELRDAIGQIARDNQRGYDNMKEIIGTLRSDLVQRMDIMNEKRK